MKYTFLFAFAFFILQSCQRDNGEINSAFEKEFNDSIEKNNAKKFDFECDGLTRQTSYFVNSKLKFLTLKIAGESVVMEEQIYFDLKTDSMSKRILRRIEYEWDETGNNVNWDKYSDTLYVINYNPKRMETFVNNEKLNNTLLKNILTINAKFIQGIKKCTEKEYNSW